MEFQNGIVPEWEWMAGSSLSEDFVGFAGEVVLNWDLASARNRAQVTFFIDEWLLN
jgi:hypothetical protein